MTESCVDVHARPDDLYYNYCWWPYRPIADPTSKLRGAALLLKTLDLSSAPEHAYEAVAALQRELGMFRTIWGAKWVEGQFRWEFYFYDYQRRRRDVSITRVLELLRPLYGAKVCVNENLHYFMFSLDMPFTEGMNRSIDHVHMYLGNPGSSVSSGVSYQLDGEMATLENFYFFFDAHGQRDQAIAKMCCSPFYDGTVLEIEALLIPELGACRTLCVANKRQCDTIYFSGIDVEQLIGFLRRFDYPSEIQHFVRKNRGQFDHLLFDVGFDYVARGREIEVLKSGFYGVF